MRNPFQITKSGTGVQAAGSSLSKIASLAQILGIADTSVALDVDVYLVSSVNAPVSVTGGTWIGKLRAPANQIATLPLLGQSGGIQISMPNVWVVANFNDAGTTHSVAVYQDQE